MKIFGLYIETRKERTKTVARECYGLAHEFVVNKLMDEFDHGGWATVHKRPILLDLDKEMKAFLEAKEDER